MDTTTSNWLIAGFAIFVFLDVAVALLFAYYVWRGKQVIVQLKDDREQYEIHWLKPQWIYLIQFITYFTFWALYMAMYQLQGFAIRPPFVIMWARWIALFIVALLYSYGLNFILTTVHRHADPQSYAMIFFYVWAYLGILLAEFSTSSGGRLLWIMVGIISFIVSLGAFILPVNKLTDPSVALKPNDSYANSYKYWYLAFMILAYVLYIFIWFFSDSSQFTDGLDFDQQIIAYFFIDLLLSLGPGVVVAIVTFMNEAPSIAIRNTETDQIEYATNVKMNKRKVL